MSVATENNPNVCADCSRWIEDESPLLAAQDFPESEASGEAIPSPRGSLTAFASPNQES